MTSYFDEHDCVPLREGEAPNHFLHLARLLLDSDPGAFNDFASLYHDERPAPPASKECVESLPHIVITASQAARGMSCPVCLAQYNEEDVAKQMPCKHNFHPKCILPWLERTNSCPVCRYELPTDDRQYEEYRRHKARKAQREFELENLHDSMYG